MSKTTTTVRKTRLRKFALTIAGVFLFIGIVIGSSSADASTEPIRLMENVADTQEGRAPMKDLVAQLKQRGWTTGNEDDDCECLYPPS